MMTFSSFKVDNKPSRISTPTMMNDDTTNISNNNNNTSSFVAETF